MMTAPGAMAGKSRCLLRVRQVIPLLNDPPGGTKEIRGCYRTAYSSFVPAVFSFVPAPESILLRDIFWASLTQAPRPSRSYPQNRRPVHLVLGQNPWLLERRRAPLGPGRQRHHRVGIGASRRAKLDGIGMEARDHGRIHGVGGTKGAEQERPVRAVAAARFGTHGGYAGY